MSRPAECYAQAMLELQYPMDVVEQAQAIWECCPALSEALTNPTISIPEKVTRLHCSYIGFEEQDIVLQAGKDTYRIVLQASAHTLGDVVVTGYQELPMCRKFFRHFMRRSDSQKAVSTLLWNMSHRLQKPSRKA